MLGDPTLSTTLLSTTLRRGAGGDAAELGSSDVATQLIKVSTAVNLLQTPEVSEARFNSRTNTFLCCGSLLVSCCVLFTIYCSFQAVLLVTADMCLVGIGTYKLATQLADFTVNLLSTGKQVVLHLSKQSMMDSVF